MKKTANSSWIIFVKTEMWDSVIKDGKPLNRWKSRTNVITFIFEKDYYNEEIEDKQKGYKLEWNIK